MAVIPYMPLYIADYLADAAHLTTLEHGAYLLMIMTYWQTGKPLPDDDKKLAAITKLNFTNYKKIKAHLKEFFLSENGHLIHKRIEQELSEFREKSDMARLAGIMSGKSRRKKTNGRSTDVQRTFNERSTDVEPRGVVRIPLNHTDTDTDIKKDKDILFSRTLVQKNENMTIQDYYDLLVPRFSSLGLGGIKSKTSGMFTVWISEGVTKDDVLQAIKFCEDEGKKVYSPTFYAEIAIGYCRERKKYEGNKTRGSPEKQRSQKAIEAERIFEEREREKENGREVD